MNGYQLAWEARQRELKAAARAERATRTSGCEWCDKGWPIDPDARQHAEPGVIFFDAEHHPCALGFFWRLANWFRKH